MRVRKCWDIEDSTGNSNQQGSVLIIIKKEDMVAIINGRRVTATLRSKVATIYSCNQPVTNLIKKQLVVKISNIIHH